MIFVSEPNPKCAQCLCKGCNARAVPEALTPPLAMSDAIHSTEWSQGAESIQGASRAGGQT